MNKLLFMKPSTKILKLMDPVSQGRTLGQGQFGHNVKMSQILEINWMHGYDINEAFCLNFEICDHRVHSENVLNFITYSFVLSRSLCNVIVYIMSCS